MLVLDDAQHRNMCNHSGRQRGFFNCNPELRVEIGSHPHGNLTEGAAYLRVTDGNAAAGSGDRTGIVGLTSRLGVEASLVQHEADGALRGAVSKARRREDGQHLGLDVDLGVFRLVLGQGNRVRLQRREWRGQERVQSGRSTMTLRSPCVLRPRCVLPAVCRTFQPAASQLKLEGALRRLLTCSQPVASASNLRAP